MDFPDKWAAIVWICRNQLGRRNITDKQKTVLIGEAYKAQKMSQGAQIGNSNAKKQSDQCGHIVSNRTRKEIANQFSVGEGTVQRAENYVDGLDEAEKIDPGFKESVLSGGIKAPKSVIREIKNVPEGKRADVVEAIRQGDTGTVKAIIQESKPATEKKPATEPEAFTPEELGELLDAALTFPRRTGNISRGEVRYHLSVICPLKLCNDKASRERYTGF